MTNAMSAPAAAGLTNINRVELSLEADAQMLFLARMTGAAVAARADFDYEQIEDLRLAIDELCVQLMSTRSGPARIILQFNWDDDGVVDVMGTRVRDERFPDEAQGDAPRATLASHELSERILDALVDDHGEDMIGGVQRAWLRIRRQDPVG